MKALWRWFKRLMFLGGLVAMVVLATQFWGPGVAQRYLDEWLEGSGLPRAKATVEWIGPTEVRVRDFQAGELGEVRVDKLRISYNPAEVAGLKVGEVEIQGGVIPIRVTERGIDLGIFEVFRAAGPATGGGGMVQPPFERITLKNCVLNLDAGGVRYSILVTGSALHDSVSKAIQLDIQATTQGVQTRVTGQVGYQAGGGGEGLAWMFNRAEAVALIEARDLLLAGPGIAVQGARGTIQATVNQEGGGWALSLGQGTNLDVRSIRGFGGDWRVEPGASGSCLSMKLTTDGRVVAFDGKSWTAQSPPIQMTMEGVAIGGAISGSRLQIGDFGLDALIRVRGSERELQVVSGRVMKAGLGSLSMGEGASVVMTEKLQFQMDAGAGGLLAKIPLTDSGRMEAYGNLRVQGPAQARIGAVKATLQTLGVEGAYIGVPGAEGAGTETIAPPLPGELQPGWRVVTRLGGGQVEMDNNLRIEGIEAIVPVSVGMPGGVEPQFKTGKITAEKREFPGMIGKAWMRDGGLELDALWPALKEAGITLKGQGRMGADGLAGQLAASTGRFVVDDPKTLQTLAPALGLVEITGTFDLRATASITGGRLTPQVSVEMEDVAVRHRELEAGAEGIAGKVTIDSFSPVSTGPAQSLRIARAYMGEMSLKEGSVAFRIDGPERFFIEKTGWTWGEAGRLMTHNVLYDAATGQMDVELFVERMNLQDWLGALTSQRVQATGLLYGRLPVIVKIKPSPAIQIGNGYLYARPDPGTIKIGDADLVGGLLEKADGRFASGGPQFELRQRIVAALSDYRYSKLTFDFVRREGRVDCLVGTVGKGPLSRSDGTAEPNPLEFGGLNFNINNFGDTLNSALIMKTGTQRAIDARLERFFE